MKVIPKLRFKEFNDNWETTPLINLSVNGFSNGAFNDPKKVGSGYRIINVKDMYIDGTINIDTLTRVAIDEQEFLKNRVEYGDIFFTRSSLVKEGIAYSNVNLNNVNDLTYDGHLIRMRPNKQKHSPVFLYYNFSTSTARKQFIKRGKTATMTTIGQEDIAKVEITYPSLPEQQKIASFLSAVDEKIQQLTRKKELLEQYKKGVMQQLFSGKLRFKDENGKPYPKWEEKRLGDIGIITTGSTPSTSIPEFYNGDNLFVSPSDIGNGRYITKTKTTLTESGIREGRLIKEGSVLFVCIGSTIGKVAQAGKECITNQQINSIEANGLNSNEFIYSLLEHNALRIKPLAGTQAVPQINKTDFSRLKFSFPFLLEQQKIASFLTTLDAKIESVATQIAQTQTFKKGLLQQMFV
ncbi:restriction endonuclease subunit S [Chryseotalea sanaruensis]|uniref:Restriction endonuclease subunit S n=1 Tax=Chryseotalea sanaruensis TaxID=2482724 RepID=A0A401U8V1_9BACT|nr:restriction endonuclease subunit S [Chryseotalea sanaruensis]GCC51321.1 restriction endonuclease subunit S [Chryseotalea sanaruensis]